MDDFKDLNVGGKIPENFPIYRSQDEAFNFNELSEEEIESIKNLRSKLEPKGNKKFGSVLYLGTGGSSSHEAKKLFMSDNDNLAKSRYKKAK